MSWKDTYAHLLVEGTIRDSGGESHVTRAVTYGDIRLLHRGSGQFVLAQNEHVLVNFILDALSRVWAELETD